jgi:hypothetical protein
MQNYRPAGRGATFGQLLLRWGFSILAFAAAFVGLDRTSNWTRDFRTELDADLGLWLQAVGLLLLAGIAFGVAVWLPVPGRGGRPSVSLGLGIPLLLLNAGYATLFHIDFGDLPDFIETRVLLHPAFSVAAASIAALFLGIVLVAGFCPAGYVPLSRIGLPRPSTQPPSAAPASSAPAPPPSSGPAPAPRAERPTPPAGRPDNQQTGRLPPQRP